MVRRPGMDKDQTYRINVLDRAVSILKVFSYGEGELSLKQIADRTGLHVSTCLRIASVLRDHGLLSRDGSSGHYRLGYELIALAEISRSTGGLVSIALPHLRGLSQTFKETAALSIRSGDHRIDLEQVVGEQQVRRVIPLGVPKPLYTGAASRVLLSGLTETELDDYLDRVPLEKLAANTITDPAELRASLEMIRRDGYAVSVQEQFDTSGCGVVAPVLGARGEVVAAMGVSVPQFRFSPSLRDQLIPAVIASASVVSQLLGNRGEAHAHAGK